MREDQLRKVLKRLRIEAGQKTAKGWLNSQCPMAQWTHKSGRDKSPSFGVIISDTGFSSYFCYGCKAKGTIGNLVRTLGHYRHENYDALYAEVTETEQSEAVAAGFDDPVEMAETPEPINEAMWDGLFEDPYHDPVSADYLKARGVSPETAANLGMGFDPEHNRIVFPVKGAKGELYGFTGRSVIPNTRVKVMDYAGLPKRHLILGRERWVTGKPVVIVEGLFAYAHFHEVGLEEIANIGALLGSEMTKEKAQVLTLFGESVFLMLDPDAAGDAGTFGRFDAMENRHKFEEGAIGLLYKEIPVFVPDFPEDVVDVDDLTFDQIAEMMTTTDIYTPTPDQLKSSAKTKPKERR